MLVNGLGRWCKQIPFLSFCLTTATSFGKTLILEEWEYLIHVTCHHWQFPCRLSHSNGYFVNSLPYLYLPSFPLPRLLKSKHSKIEKAFLPPFAGDDPHLFTVPLQRDSPGLPPLVIRGVDNVENISIFKTKSLTWQPTVLALVIVKHGSVEMARENVVRNLCSTDFKFSILITPSCPENPSSIWYQHQGLTLRISVYIPPTVATNQR